MNKVTPVFFALHIAACFSGVDGTAIAAGDNAEHFRILCRVYKTATQVPHALYDPTSIDDVSEKIDVFSAALSDDKWYADVLSASKESKIPEELAGTSTVMKGNWSRWRKAVVRISTDPEVAKIPSGTPAIKTALERLKVIEKHVEKILQDIQKTSESVDLAKLQTAFSEAIFGNLGEDNERTYHGTSSRGQTCGSSGLGSKGANTGDSLVIDFLCLCAKDSSGIDKACGEDVSIASPEWTVGSTNSGKQIWTKIRDACIGRTNTKNVTAEYGVSALYDFVAKISVDTQASSRKPGLFGTITTAGTPACDGQNADSNHGICVYYGTDLKQIKWLQKIKNGIAELEKAHKGEATIRNAITHLKMLGTRAEEIYEEAKATLDQETTTSRIPTKNQTMNQKPPTPSDKGTAQEPSALSKAGNSRYILPWTLLI
uniref:Variable surface glycoprotein n=1 Tax=Trypanosoma congolense TaxID=5692 RepID=Q26979_TRYCO|nr:variable surface glycoprotein [Trypanosoma congolense]